MRFRILSAAGLLATMAGALSAQGGGGTAHASCTGTTADACQQTVDLFHYMAPQLGTAIAGANTTLLQGGNLGNKTLGMIPFKLVVGARVNLVLGNVPTMQTPTATLTQRTGVAAGTAMVPMPAVDAAIGVYPGFPLGVTSVGGVDILLSAAYVPKADLDAITVTPDSPLKIGYGIRIGLLKEGLLAPGIGFSYIMRGLPKTTITSTAGTGATATTLTIKDLDLKANSWRLTASKSLLIFGLAACVGQDKYSGSTSITVQPGAAAATAPFAVKQDVTRMNYFGEIGMNLVVLKLVASGGMVSGGDITTYNGYDNAADMSRTYASFGVRFGL